MKKQKYSIEFAKSVLKKYINVNTILYIGSGNHSDAFLINNNLVVKLPKHKKASVCLQKEINVLKQLDGKLNLSIPTVEFVGTFMIDKKEYCFFASKKLSGKKFTKNEFTGLSQNLLNKNAEIIANFLLKLHNQKYVLNINRKDLFLLHGDFSLNHCLFDDNNLVCGILDFGDAKAGKSKSDFIYLLDEEDEEEFGIEFGVKVLQLYNNGKGK